MSLLQSPTMVLPGTPTHAIDATGSSTSVGGADAEFRRGWLECFARDAEASIHQHPEVVDAGQPPDSEHPVLLSHRDSGRLCSLAILTAWRFGVQVVPGLPLELSLRGLKLLRSRVLGDNSTAAITGIVECMRELLISGRRRFVYIDELDADTQLAAACESVGNLRVYRPGQMQSHWTLEFPANPGDYWEKMSKKTRYNIRRCARRLDHELICCREATQVEELLAKVGEVSAKTWQRRRMGRQLDGSPAQVRTWKKIAALGAMRSYVLEHAGSPIAFALCVQWKGRFVYDEIGFDGAFAEASPGTVLLHDLIEDLIARDTPRCLDFGFGDNEYKRIFGTRRTDCGPVLLVAPALKCRCVVGLDRMRRSAGAAARWTAERLKVRRMLHRLYRK